MTTAPPDKAPVAPSSSTLIGFYRSPIGKKILTGVTGLGLATFIVAHMLGNLLLFFSSNAYNAYAHWLETVAPLLWAVELVLLVGVILHASLGIQIYLNKRRARPVAYNAYQSAGQPSHQTLSSRTMIWSGITLAAFIVWHLLTFKFGPRYPVAGTLAGTSESMRDIADLVFVTFQQPAYTLLYTLCLGLLGIHLRHGIWSACQSLGVLTPKTISFVAQLSLILAVVITLGFLIVPWAIFLGWLGAV